MKKTANALKPPSGKNSRRRKASPVGSQARVNRKERVLVEFPARLLERADQAALGLETNRSELIRQAVERLLEDMEASKLERELADAYAANSEMNRALAREFAAVDREGL